ncbi:hypothetical protein MRB53_009807 [Persea americana]|uniref:Uncharacterized protein n=1 Tax=Persea americana TaxID=3435 RepID=A0ACC2LQE9_PERAE|nr:hypothetical protein MRB53_009807 [Persea americana]
MGSTKCDNDPSEDTAVADGTHSRPLMLYSQSERDEWHRFRDGIARRLWDETVREICYYSSKSPSTKSSDANFSPLQDDSDVGLIDRLGGCRIQSSSVETSSGRTNPRKRNSELLEIIHCIERSSEGLTTATRDVVDTIRLPKRLHSSLILTELHGIPLLSGLDVEIAHKRLIVQLSSLLLTTRENGF